MTILAAVQQTRVQMTLLGAVRTPLINQSSGTRERVADREKAVEGRVGRDMLALIIMTSCSRDFTSPTQ